MKLLLLLLTAAGCSGQAVLPATPADPSIAADLTRLLP
jgi:hypothetical protein